MPDPQSPQMELVASAAPSLRLKTMSALEEVSRLFEFQIIAVSDDRTISANDLLATTAAVSIEVADGSKRWFHGVVASFGIEGVVGREFSYRVTLRPWAWLMTRSANVRIFQQQSTPDIIKAVLGEYPVTFIDKMTGSYQPRDYCVQYRESDFNFVSRLMEEEGIFYFFQHTDSKHDMVLADAASAHTPLTGFEEVLYLEDDRDVAEQQAINDWHMRHEIQPGKTTLRDYNFETPSTDLLSTPATSSRSHAEATHEVYDYPGLYKVKGDGDARATIRMDEASARFGRFTGAGNVPGLAAGSRFTLKGHPRDDQNAEYLLLQTQIDLEQAGPESSDSGDTKFLCRFTAQSYADVFHPARTTRKPSVAGPQTALVVGGGGAGEIETDQYGRIKVQFYWDRLGQKNADSSCWLRVATGWAGNGWGMISLPRIGQEVVVAFLEGDPDQPLVVGSVYNAEQMPPYELPANATVSTLKSRSVQGETDAFNELRFDDKAGDEYVWFQAQKDSFEFIEETVKAQIGKDEHRSIKENRKEKIEGEYHLNVVGAVKQKFGAKVSMDVTDDMSIKGAAKFSLKTGADFIADSGATISFKSAADLHLKIGANIGAVAAQNVHIKGGTNIVLEAGTQISIKAGASSIVLGSDGVSITGSMVKINSGGSPGSGAGASPVAPTDPEAPEDPELPEDPLTHR